MVCLCTTGLVYESADRSTYMCVSVCVRERETGKTNVKEEVCVCVCVCVSARAASSFAVPAFYSGSEVRHVPGTWHSTKH